MLRASVNTFVIEFVLENFNQLELSSGGIGPIRALKTFCLTTSTLKVVERKRSDWTIEKIAKFHLPSIWILARQIYAVFGNPAF